MRALMPSECETIIVVTGDLVEIMHQPARDFYGKFCIVLESPSHFAAKRAITYHNDWIWCYSPKIKRGFQVRVGEYKKVNKSS
jgi:hypothetical protein